MYPQQDDRFVMDTQEYVFRDGYWTTPAGYRVSTSHAQTLTTAFYRKTGRVPESVPPPPPPPRSIRRRRAPRSS